MGWHVSLGGFGGRERRGARTAIAEAAKARRERNLVEGMMKAAVGTAVMWMVVWCWG
jgi:hypothetical protein